jgi:Rad3-related DNA helicase
VRAAPARLGALTKRDTHKLYRQLTSAAELLRTEEACDAARPALLRAHAPWRDHSYDLAFDARVDTSFQHRSHHYTTTAATVVALHDAARGAVAVFFPSYAYADAILKEVAALAPELRVVLQPRLRDLAAQSAWVDTSLLLGHALFLVLGSSFAESIDALGGRVTHAMVVGPALPEVNAVQRARLAEATRAGMSRDAAFRRVYQIPGMTKVNQALGRLVRAPAQRARVILHCRRFLDPGYASLLAPEYQLGTRIDDDEALRSWLAVPPAPAAPN